MAIQHRRGEYKDFDKNKLIPGELAFVLSGDPESTTGRALYACFGENAVKRMTTYDDFENEVSNISESLNKKVDSMFIGIPENYAALAQDVAEIKRYLGLADVDPDIVGLRVERTDTTVKYTRLESARNLTYGTSFNKFPIYGQMKYVLLAHDGSEIMTGYDVIKYMQQTNPEEYEGEVMVKIPKCYYRINPLKMELTENGDSYSASSFEIYLSSIPKIGFSVHPAFIKNGIERSCIYVGAYDMGFIGSDNNAVSRPQITLPDTLSKSVIEEGANLVGNRWYNLDIQTYSLLQMMLAIECGTLKVGNILGGRNAYVDGLAVTGASSYVWRNIENVFGNGAKVLSGIEVDMDRGVTVDPVYTFTLDDSVYGKAYTGLDDWIFLFNGASGGRVYTDNVQSVYNALSTTSNIVVGNISLSSSSSDTGLFAATTVGSNAVENLTGRLCYYPDN